MNGLGNSPRRQDALGNIIVISTDRHRQELANNMAYEDARECYDFGVSPYQALKYSAERPGLMRTVLRGPFDVNNRGKVVGCFGVSIHSPDDAAVWSLWRQDMTAADSLFVMKNTAPQLLDMFERLHLEESQNFISLENRRSINWIDATGAFTWGPDTLINERIYRSFKTSRELLQQCADR